MHLGARCRCSQAKVFTLYTNGLKSVEVAKEREAVCALAGDFKSSLATGPTPDRPDLTRLASGLPRLCLTRVIRPWLRLNESAA